MFPVTQVLVGRPDFPDIVGIAGQGKVVILALVDHQDYLAIVDFQEQVNLVTVDSLGRVSLDIRDIQGYLVIRDLVELVLLDSAVIADLLA